MKRVSKYQLFFRFFYDHAKLIVLSCVMLLLLYGAIGAVTTYHETRKKKQEMDRNLSALSEKETNLSQTVDRLGTTNGIEQNLRDTYRVAKTGEGLVVVVDTPLPPQAEEASAFTKIRSFFNKLLR